MPHFLATFDQLLSRTWRASPPLRPRISALRRYGMFCLLCFLLSIIAAYAYLTDSNLANDIWTIRIVAA